MKYNEEKSSVDISEIVHIENNLFSYVLDKNKINAKIEFRLLDGNDDNQLFLQSEKQRKNKQTETNFTNRLRKMIVSINDETDQKYINLAVHKLPLIYAKELLEAYKAIAPSVQIMSEYDCEHCSSMGVMEVPLSVDFFWPDRWGYSKRI